MENFYEILGVDRKTSEEDIKKAYRQLAHKYHPDRPGGDEKKFKKINEAYQVLSDKKKRAEYDRFGRVFSGSGPNYGGESAGFGNWPFGEAEVNFGDFGGLGDIFDVFFGDQRRTIYRRGADLEIIAEVSLEEAMSGKTLKLNFRTKIKCDSCGGRGYEEKKGFSTCSVCGGRGEINEARKTFFGNFSRVASCSDCRGTGRVPNEKCFKCRGEGRTAGEKEATVEIRPGIEDGQIIKLKGFGEAGEAGAGSGDLYVRIKIKPHPVFKRVGRDLIINYDLKWSDALLRRKIQIPTLRGRKIEIEIPTGFNLRDDFIIPGEGIAAGGNLIVRFNFKTPAKLTPKLKKLLEDFLEE